MKQCVRCRGLVPESVPSCPNCEVAQKRRGTKGLLAAAGLISLAANNCNTAVALYGVPCTTKLADGGNGCVDVCQVALPDGGEPIDDPANACYVPRTSDGGR